MDRNTVLRWAFISLLAFAFMKWGMPLVTGKHEGTPQQLKEASRSAHLEVTLTEPHPDAVGAMGTLVAGRVTVSDDGRRLSAAVDAAPGLATSVVRAGSGS